MGTKANKNTPLRWNATFTPSQLDYTCTGICSQTLIQIQGSRGLLSFTAWSFGSPCSGVWIDTGVRECFVSPEDNWEVLTLFVCRQKTSMSNKAQNLLKVWVSKGPCLCLKYDLKPQIAPSVGAIHTNHRNCCLPWWNEITSLPPTPSKVWRQFLYFKNTIRSICFPDTFVSVTSYHNFSSGKAHLEGFHAPNLSSPPTQVPQCFTTAAWRQSSEKEPHHHSSPVKHKGMKKYS